MSSNFMPRINSASRASFLFVSPASTYWSRLHIQPIAAPPVTASTLSSCKPFRLIWTLNHRLLSLLQSGFTLLGFVFSDSIETRFPARPVRQRVDEPPITSFTSYDTHQNLIPARVVERHDLGPRVTTIFSRACPRIEANQRLLSVHHRTTRPTPSTLRQRMQLIWFQV